jgi:uncharacterized protein
MGALAARIFKDVPLRSFERKALRELLDVAQREISPHDPAHDFSHAVRVLGLAMRLWKKEGGDPLVIGAAALFHDLIVYPKNSPDARHSAARSAVQMGDLLRKTKLFPRAKIGAAKYVVSVCSFSHGKECRTIEAKVVKDADSIEKSGVIAFMRAYSTGGQLGRPFFDVFAPLTKAEPGALTTINYLQLLVEILEGNLETESARETVGRRIMVMKSLIASLRDELSESGVLG